MTLRVSAQEPGRLTGICLAVLCIAILIGASYWILLPFLPALVWATMIVVSTWPLMLAAQRRLNGSRTLATALMIFALFLVLIVPLFMAISTIIANTDVITTSIHSALEFERPAPPEWLNDIPIAGPKLIEKWNSISSANKDDFIAKATPYMGGLLAWFAAQVGNLGMLFIHFLLTLILASVLYVNGETAARGVKRFAGSLGGERGEEAAQLAAKAIRAVALGVVGTALCQSVIAGSGFLLAGIPQAMLLTAIVFFFSVIQIGAVPVMIPVVIWLFWSGSPGWGTMMIVWTVIVGVLDNFLRPMLIKRGANLPLLLIFGGVVGGLIAFGIIGLFVGPVMLAVSYTLLNAWIGEEQGNALSAGR